MSELGKIINGNTYLHNITPKYDEIEHEIVIALRSSGFWTSETFSFVTRDYEKQDPKAQEYAFDNLSADIGSYYPIETNPKKSIGGWHVIGHFYNSFSS